MDELDKKIKSIWSKAKETHKGGGKQPCPEDSVLSSFIDGGLKESVREGIEKHLLACGDCLDIVIAHSKMSAEEAHETIPEVPAFLMNKAMSLVRKKESGPGFVDIVLKFARETIEIISNPGNLGISYNAVPVPVRGEGSTQSANIITLNRAFSDVECAADVEMVRAGHINIKAMIRDVRSGKPAEGLRINLFNPDREIASHIAKEGEVYFKCLTLGQYIIKIDRQGNTIGQLSMNIEE